MSLKGTCRKLSLASRECVKLMTATCEWELLPLGWTGLHVLPSWGDGRHEPAICIYSFWPFRCFSLPLQRSKTCLFFSVMHAMKLNVGMRVFILRSDIQIYISNLLCASFNTYSLICWSQSLGTPLALILPSNFGPWALSLLVLVAPGMVCKAKKAWSLTCFLESSTFTM